MRKTRLLAMASAAGVDANADLAAAARTDRHSQEQGTMTGVWLGKKAGGQ